MAFARKVALSPPTPSPQADVDDLRALGLSDEDILDVILAAAARCFFSKTLDATGTTTRLGLQQPARRPATALTVGRPIDA